MSTGEQPLAIPATARQAADALLAGKYHTGVPELPRAMADEIERLQLAAVQQEKLK